MRRTTIRFARREDAAALAAVYAPYVENTAITFELSPPSPHEMEARLERILAHAAWLVYEVDGRVEGYAYLSRHHERAAYQWSLDASVFLNAEHQRRGAGRALYTALFGLARLQGFCAVHAGITLPNPASVGLHEGIGFRRVATYPAVGYKLGAWHDVGWWQLELRARQAAPPSLLTPDQARAGQADDWEAVIEAAQRLLK